MKTAALVLAALLLSGCASSPRWLENRAVCTVDGTGAYVVSKWGPVAFGSPLAKGDAAVICNKAAS